MTRARARRLVARLVNVVRPGRTEPELARELAAHLAMLEDDLVGRGLSRDEARLAARRAFGGVELTKDRHRDARSFVWLDDARRDLRYGLRSLRRTPGFTIVVVTTLALGIGANTAMFTLADGLLLRPIAARDPTKLIASAARDLQGRPAGILASMIDLIRQEGVLPGVCGFVTPSIIVEMHGRVGAVPTHAFTGDCFETLGIDPAAGRLLTRGDERSGAERVAVLSYDAWIRDYGGRASAVGETIDVDGAPYRIVGVAQRGFAGVRVGFPARLFIPFGNFGGGLAAYFPPRDVMPMGLLARLPPDMSVDAAAVRLRALWRSWLEKSVPSRLRPAQRDRYLHLGMSLTQASTGVDDSLRHRFQRPVIALLAIAGLVLLLACMNVANLLLARFSERRREAAIRIALGASARRLAQAAAIESAALLAAGAVASLPLAYWVDAVLIAIFKSTSPDFAIDIAPDRRVLMFTACLSTIAFFVFALVPAWQASRIDASARVGSPPRSSHGRNLQRAGIVGQVALTIILIAVGALFVGMLRQLRAAPLGLSVEGTVAAQLSPVPGGYQQGFAAGTYYRTLLDRIDELAGIDAAALSYNAPLIEIPATTPVGQPGSDAEVTVEQAFVSDSFFSTMRIPLIAGGSFGRDDRPAGVRTAILSQSVARWLFGSSNAVGRTIHVGASPANQSLRIVGVAADAVLSSPQQRQTRVVYMNFWQAGPSFQLYPTLLVRTRERETASAEALTHVVEKEGHEYVSQARPLIEQRDASLVQERLLATLSIAFAVLGLTLAAVGLYGLLRLSVTQRKNELGVRMALGARRSDILLLVLRDAWLVVAVGTVVGAPVAWAASGLAAALLYGRPTPGVAPAAIAVAVLFVVASVAAWMPARRAAKVDPVVALRCE